MIKRLFAFTATLICVACSLAAQSIEEAKKLTDNEQYEAATAIYQALLSKNPNDANVYYYFGDNLLLSENPDSAKLIFEKGRAIDPANPLLKIGLAKLQLNAISLPEAKSASDKDTGNPELRIRSEQALENTTNAKKLIDEAIASSPKDPRVMIEAAEALIHYKNKDVNKAKTFLDKANTLDAKNPEINILYGDIYSELNNGTLAADYYNRALDQDKTSARAIVSKGRLYNRSTNYEGAAGEFENAIKVEPAYAPAHRELAESYFRLGKIDKGKEEYRKYLELSKNGCSARIRFAGILYFTKDYTGALNELGQIQQKCDPNNARMLRIKMFSYYETKEFGKGLDVAKQLFNVVTPENRVGVDYEYYGKLLVASNQDSLAIEQFRKALSLDPGKTDLLIEIANSWYRLKNYPNAISTFEERLATGKPMKTLEYYNLGQSYYFNQQFEKADSTYMKINEMAPTWATGWLGRARVNSHIDSTSEAGLAKPFYEKYDSIAGADSVNIVKYQGGLSEAYGYLAYYYILKEDKKNALIYLKKKLLLPLEPEEKKKIQDGIDQLEGRTPKGKSQK
jgi:Flp pilus assembly protein TadD